jgi:hypothetical protein
VKTLSAFGALAIAGISGLGFEPCFAQAAGPAQPSVVELFTSQGCSSCPPADRVLRQLSERPDVIALSFPVTYWDYLGWKDTLARPENSERQRRYAAVQGSEVYTPEAVVNGVKECVGSDLGAIESALKATASLLRKESVPLSVRQESGKLVIETGAAPPDSEHKTGKVWVAAVRQSADVAIAAGENKGQKITYTNVVLGFTEAGGWHGAPASFAIPSSAIPKDRDMLVVFLQAEPLGAIVGAARVRG